ncbi:MAG: polynucleotide adenylyltransferase PcnB [Myxococcales bacterium]|nr:polynucleotide adenylyltransferase PcnB [Myxococcales bacterium]
MNEQSKQGSNDNPAPDAPEPSQSGRSRGALDLRDVDHDAIKVVRKLLAAGHEAFLVGGCVRDLYLNRRPKDFDVATSARPEQIRRVFRNSRIIGRRFKLAHVFFGPKVIETSTFRANPNTEDDASSEEDLLITHDNEWGSVEEDARRRDFTINGLFLDVERNAIVDFVDGVSDLDRGIIRTIGEPVVRFREDPVRMIRAIKFAARLDFTIEPESWAALLECVPDIARCSRARLVEELYKLLRGGSARRSFELMMQAQLFPYIWPDYVALYEPWGGLRRPVAGEAQEGPPALFWRYLQALDDYVSETGQIPSNPVIQTVLFAPLLDAQLLSSNRSDLDGEIDDLMTPPCAALGVARRDRELARQIFMAHRRMVAPSRRRGRKSSLVQRQYFHDALLFLGFTVEVREQDGGNVLEHWRALATVDDQQTSGGSSSSGSGSDSGPGAGGKRRRGRRRSRGGKGGKRSGGNKSNPASASAGEG